MGKVDDEEPGSVPSCLCNVELKQQRPRQFPGLTAPDNWGEGNWVEDVEKNDALRIAYG